MMLGKKILQVIKAPKVSLLNYLRVLRKEPRLTDAAPEDTSDVELPSHNVESDGRRNVTNLPSHNLQSSQVGNISELPSPNVKATEQLHFQKSVVSKGKGGSSSPGDRPPDGRRIPDSIPCGPPPTENRLPFEDPSSSSKPYGVMPFMGAADVDPFDGQCDSSNLPDEQYQYTSSHHSSAVDLVIAVDFGTTFSGVAWAHSSALDGSHQSQLVDSIHTVRTWPNPNRDYLEKTPTLLSYRCDPPLWGGRVKTSDDLIVRYFKLGLEMKFPSEFKPLQEFLLSQSRYLPDREPIDFCADYLAALLEFVKNNVLSLIYDPKMLSSMQISYVLAVPAIWTDKAKDLIRQAANRAGIPTRSLTLITEPEAAALYCSIFRDAVELKPGDRFVVCDAGGGTVVRHLWAIS